jgi:hypothetical protein
MAVAPGLRFVAGPLQLFRRSSRPEKDRIAYEQFLTLWKAADRDIPVFRQAKSEYLELSPVQLAPK